MEQQESIFSEENLIDTYTREQALEDGVLIDITSIAKHFGIRHPLAATTGAIASITPTENDTRLKGETIENRLLEILSKFLTIARSSKGMREIRFEVLIDRQRYCKPKLETFKMACGPDDYGNPCLTLMLPTED